MQRTVGNPETDERVNRLWAIPMVAFVGAFLLAMIYYGSLGSNVPESYTTIMLSGFLGLIGMFMAVDVLSRHRYQSPTIIVGSLAALNCFIMLIFVKSSFRGYSIGFLGSSIGVAVFLLVFFYVAFFTT